MSYERGIVTKGKNARIAARGFLLRKGEGILSPTTAGVLEEGTQGATILTFTRRATGAVSLVSISSVTPTNAVQLNADGLTLEYGSARINLEAPLTEVTFNYNFTDSTGAKVIPVRLIVTNLADAPTVTGAAATADAAFAGLTTFVEKAVDLRTLFGATNAAPLSYAASVGTIAGDGYSWTYTPTPADYEVYGDPANFRITITATDANGQTGIAETVQGITLVNTAPAGANSTGTFVALAGSAPVIAPASSSPADGATGVAVGSNIVVAYDRPVKAGASGQGFTVRNVSDGVDVEFFDVVADQGTGPGQVSISGNNVTLNPTSNLSASKNYAIRVTAGAVTNLGGINCAAVTGDTTLDFTTGSGATAPAQFGSGDWSLADPKLADGTINVVITALPSDGGSAITALERQLDGGSWVSLGGTTTGTYTVAGTYGTLATIAIRAVNTIGQGTASADKTVTPRGIRLVGIVTGDIPSGNAATSKSLSLTGLTGGSRAAAQAGDVVLGLAVGAAGAEITFAVTSTGYTDVRTRQYVSPSTNDVTMLCSYKVLTGADTTIDWGSFTGNGAQGKVFHAVVLEGVDNTTPLDGVSVVSNTFSSGGLLDLTSITPATLQAWIVGFYGSAFGSTAKTYAGPSNMTELTNTTRTTSTRSSSGIICRSIRPDLTAFDPNATTIATGSDAAADSTAGVLISLRAA